MLTLFILFSVSIPVFSQSVIDAKKAQILKNLRYEPIQPIFTFKNLNADKILLGEKLFNDTRLSSDNKKSCASCHFLKINGADVKQYSLGHNYFPQDTNTPTVFNSGINHRQYWDGRAKTLEELIDFVVVSETEFSTSWSEIIKKLRQDKSYTSEFNKLYPDGITGKNIKNLISTFERSLMSTNSRFDRFLLGEIDVLNENEKKGYHLFKSYGCVSCHQGSNVGGNLFMKFGLFGDYFAARGKITQADLGRFNVTGKEKERYVFRVPSLRLVAITAPYFHDGSVTSLEAAVEIMAEYQLGRHIPKQDIRAIVAFLKTLVGNYKNKPLYPIDLKELKELSKSL